MTIKIHNKEYKTVAERVNEIHELSKDKPLSIETELVSWENAVVVFKATITTDQGVFTGHAYEDETRGQINKTSALENCETSAIGRALASAGLAGTEFASANEVENAIYQQSQKPDKTGDIKQRTDEEAEITATSFSGKLAEYKRAYDKVGRLASFKNYLKDEYGTDNEVEIVKNFLPSARTIIKGLNDLYKEGKK